MPRSNKEPVRTSRKTAGTRTTSAKPASVKLVRTKPASAKPASVKPASVKPASVKQLRTKPASAKPASVKQLRTKPASAKPASVKPASVKQVRTKPASARPAIASKPGKPVTTAQQKQQGKQTSSNWDATIDVDGELFEEAEWDTVEPPVLSSIEARQRIEILREERQLQQALEDSFDF